MSAADFVLSQTCMPDRPHWDAETRILFCLLARLSGEWSRRERGRKGRERDDFTRKWHPGCWQSYWSTSYHNSCCSWLLYRQHNELNVCLCGTVQHALVAHVVRPILHQNVRWNTFWHWCNIQTDVRNIGQTLCNISFQYVANMTACLILVKYSFNIAKILKRHCSYIKRDISY